MKILVITNMYPRDDDPSYGVFVAEQHDALRAKGVAADLYIIEGFRSRGQYLRAIFELRRRRRCYRLFHAHHAYATLAAWLAGVRPLVATFHDNQIPASRWYRLFARALASRVDCLIAVSPAVVRVLAPARCVTIPMGTDLNLFSPRDKAACRRALGWPDDRVYILFPAKPTRPEKRYDLAAQAAALSRRRHAGLELVTSGGYRRDEMGVLFGAADAVVVTSDVELGPLTVKEAIASGRPVVSRRVGDVEFLEKCPACIVVGDTPAAVAEGIERALDAGTADPSPVRPYGADAVAARLVALYDEVIAANEAKGRVH